MRRTVPERSGIFIIWVVLFLLFLSAKEGAAASLALRDAVNQALMRSPHIRASEEGLQAAKAREQGSLSQRLPSIDFEESYMRTDQPVASFGSLLNQGRFSAGLLNPATDPTLAALNHPDSLDNFRTKFTVSQPLFTGGKLHFHRKMSQGEREAVEKDLEHTKAYVGFKAIEAYWGLSLARESREVARMAVTTAEESLRQIELLYEEGTVVRSDLLSAKVQMADFKDQLVRAKGEERLAERVLDVLIGRSEDGKWEVVPLCPPGTPEIPDLDTKKLLETAKEKRPEYLAMNARWDAAKAGVKAAKGGYLPNFGVEASYEWNAPRFADDLEGSYMLGVGLNWNLFRGFGDHAQLKEAKSNQGMLWYGLKRMEDRMTLEIEQAAVAVTTGRERLQVTREQVGLAEESLRIIRKRYQEGLTTVVELEQAELALSRSRLGRFKAVYDLRLALARLRLVTGDLVVSLQSFSCATEPSSDSTAETKR